MNNLELCDRSWIEHFTTQCQAITKEFAGTVYHLQDGLVKEQQKSYDLAKRCSKLQEEVANLEQQLQLRQQSCKFCQSTSTTSSSSQNDLTRSTSFSSDAEIKEAESKTSNDQLQKYHRYDVEQSQSQENDQDVISQQPQEYGQNADSLLQPLNDAMLSEQLQMDNSGMLSPGQHQRSEYIPETEYPATPHSWRISSKVQKQQQQQHLKHNTSPNFKLQHNNENYGALGFVRANGRVGKTVSEEHTTHNMLREKNFFDVSRGSKSKTSGKLNRKGSEWLSKGLPNSSISKKGNLKRAKTYSAEDEDIFKKRSLLTLNKSSDRKLKQPRLTQMQIMQKERHNQENISTFCEEVTNAEQCSDAEVDLTTDHCHRTNTDDIFHCTDVSDLESCDTDKTDKLARVHAQRPTAEVFPFSSEHLTDDENPSVVIIAPPTPTIICLKDSNDELDDSDDDIPKFVARHREHVPQYNAKSNVKIESLTPDTQQRNDIQQQNERTEKNRQPLSDKVQTLYDEWEHDFDERDFLKTNQTKKASKKFSLKEEFNVECELCENYIEFLGGNTMARDEIEKVLRSCMRHNSPNQNRFASPPNFWNPLMTTFSQNDPRNQTLLEDPVQRPKRSGI